MHSRRLASVILGMWLGCSVFMMVVAASNFALVDTVLKTENKQAVRQIETLTPEGARMFLRYLASEMNRYFFRLWGKAQLVTGAILFLILVFATNGNKYVLVLTLGMLGLVAVMHFGLTPAITGLGRAIDYVPAEPATPDRVEFRKLHGAFLGIEITKMSLGVLLGAWLLMDSRANEGSRRHRRQHRQEPEIGEQVDAVDGARHDHADR